MTDDRCPKLKNSLLGSSRISGIGYRQAGIGDVPLLCATEIDVPGALPRTIRLLAHFETDRSRDDVRHVYLRGAASLRTDLPR